MVYAITPVPKPRQTRADKWKLRPPVVRYRAFADQVRALGIKIPESGCKVIFRLPMPDSWSKKKKAEMDGQPHQVRADLDNLIKSLLDAAYQDDCTVWQISAEKRWAITGSITIETKEEL